LSFGKECGPLLKKLKRGQGEGGDADTDCHCCFYYGLTILSRLLRLNNRDTECEDFCWLW
jgi:hypothetical protein